MAMFPVAGATLAALVIVCFVGAAFLLRRTRALRVPLGPERPPREERDPTRAVKRQSAALLAMSLVIAVLGVLVFYLLLSVTPLLGLV